MSFPSSMEEKYYDDGRGEKVIRLHRKQAFSLGNIECFQWAAKIGNIKDH